MPFDNLYNGTVKNKKELITLPSEEQMCESEKLYKLSLIDTLISKHSDRLKIMKENLSREIDILCDKDIESYNKSMQLVAEFCTDLKKLKKGLFK